MTSETIDIHVGISWLMDIHDVSERIKSVNGTLLNGRKYELIHDEGKDSWEVWGEGRETWSDPRGEGRETWSDPWHLIIRVEYPDGLSNVIIHHDYLKVEETFGAWMRNLEYEGKQLIAVITDSDDWSVYRGGPVRTVPA